MKRMLTIAVVIAIAISSCKKDVDQPPTPPVATAGPTFVMSPTFGFTSYVPPQTNCKIFEGEFAVKTREKFFVRGAAMKFTTTGGVVSSYKNLRYSLVKKNGAFAVPPGLLSGPLTPTVTSTGVAPLDTGEVCSAVLTVDMPTAGFTGTIVAEVTISYDYWDPIQKKTVAGSLTVTGQLINFGNATLTTAVHTSSPQPKAMIPGQSDTTLSLSLTAVGGDVEVTTIPIVFTNQFAVERVDVYEGANVLGSVSVTPVDTAKVGINFWIAAGTTQVFTIRPVLKPVTSGAQSGISIKTTVANVLYRIPSGDVKIAAGVRTGNDIYVVKAKQQFDWVSLPTGLTNGMASNLYGFKITSIGNTTASKQFAFDVNLIDNPTHTDTLRITNIGLMVNGVPVPAANIRKTNQNGQVIDSITASDTRVYITFVSGSMHELVTFVGSPKTVLLTGTPKGFNDPGDGDAIRIQLMLSDPYTAFKYGNSGVAPNNQNAKIGPTQSPSASAQIYASTWSDMAEVGHSFILGACTPDALNGFYHFGATVPAQVIHQ